MDPNYLVVKKETLPEIYDKVIQAKELIKAGKVKGITDAVKAVGISRSAYYKYADSVFKLSEDAKGKKATVSFLLCDERGSLSKVLNIIADSSGNIITINQGIPINGIANVTISVDISHFSVSLEEALNRIQAQPGVSRLELVALGF